MNSLINNNLRLCSEDENDQIVNFGGTESSRLLRENQRSFDGIFKKQMDHLKLLEEFVRDLHSKNLNLKHSLNLLPASPEEINRRVHEIDSMGGNFLHHAASDGNAGLVELLILLGADLNLKDSYGNTALHCAAMGKHKDIVDVLISYGAQSDLRAAVLLDNIRMARKLIVDGANVNENYYSFDVSPLHIAVKRRSKRMAKLLISFGANTNVRSYQWYGPLHFAALNGDSRMVAYLISMGAEVNSRSEDKGNTSLHHVIQCERRSAACYFNTMEILISYGADVNMKNHEGFSPLYFAARKGNIKTVKLLLSKGAKIDVGDTFKNTPIGIAVLMKHMKIATLLSNYQEHPFDLDI